MHGGAPIAAGESVQVRPGAEGDVQDALDLQVQLSPHARGVRRPRDRPAAAAQLSAGAW